MDKVTNLQEITSTTTKPILEFAAILTAFIAHYYINETVIDHHQSENSNNSEKSAFMPKQEKEKSPSIVENEDVIES